MITIILSVYLVSLFIFWYTEIKWEYNQKSVFFMYLWVVIILPLLIIYNLIKDLYDFISKKLK